MVLLKSKRFWICSILIFCAVIFLGVVVHRANQPQAVIMVYKAVEFQPRRTPKAPAPPLRADSASAEADTPVDGGHSDFSQDTETETTDRYTQHELPPTNVDTPTGPHLASDPTAVPEEEADWPERLAEIRVEIPQLLLERLDLLELVDELAPSNGGPPELWRLRDDIFEETLKLRRTIFDLGTDYITYSHGDFSPFQPGGEFYDLLELNHMGIIEGVR